MTDRTVTQEELQKIWDENGEEIMAKAEAQAKAKMAPWYEYLDSIKPKYNWFDRFLSKII